MDDQVNNWRLWVLLLVVMAALVWQPWRKPWQYWQDLKNIPTTTALPITNVPFTPHVAGSYTYHQLSPIAQVNSPGLGNTPTSTAANTAANTSSSHTTTNTSVANTAARPSANASSSSSHSSSNSANTSANTANNSSGNQSTTYQNAAYGYSFNYLSGSYQLVDTSSPTTGVTPQATGVSVNLANNSQSGGSIFSIQYAKDLPALDASSIADYSQIDIQSVTPISIFGQDAYMTSTTFDSNQPITTYYFANSAGKLLTITLVSDNSFADAIFQSFSLD